MFGFFGLGLQEIVILAVLGGGVAIVVALVVLRSSSSSGRLQALEDENRRLRAEPDRTRDRPA